MQKVSNIVQFHSIDVHFMANRNHLRTLFRLVGGLPEPFTAMEGPAIGAPAVICT